MENPTKMDEIHGKSYRSVIQFMENLTKWMRFMENPMVQMD